MIKGLFSLFLERLADRIADFVIVQLRKQAKLKRIDGKGQAIKRELNEAQTPSEREAVLDKIHNLDFNTFSTKRKEWLNLITPDQFVSRELMDKTKQDYDSRYLNQLLITYINVR